MASGSVWLDDAFPNMYRVSVSDTLAFIHRVSVPPVHAAPKELAVQSPKLFLLSTC